MAYALTRADHSVQAGARRIAAEQIERAIAEIDDTGLDRHGTVHQVRKRCKKVRGLIRLVRPAFKGYKAENAAVRDAARTLSRFREYLALIETCAVLTGHTEGESEAAALAAVRAVLDDRRAAVDRDPAELEAALAAFRDAMAATRERVNDWRLAKTGFKALKGGLRRTYERGLLALDEAQQDPVPARMHEWRKRVKYHWYHLRLLENVWPAMLSAREKAADDLGEMLGDDHNFTVLGATVAADPAAFGDNGTVVIALIGRRSAELRRAAFSLGRRLYAEDPQDLVDQFRVYWKEWRADEAADQPAGPALQPA